MRARNAWLWIRTLELVPSTSFLFPFFFSGASACLPSPHTTRNENGEYTLDVVTREQSDKESPTARTSEKASNAAATTVGHSLPRCRTIVSFPSRIYWSAERFVAGTREQVNYVRAKTLASREYSRNSEQKVKRFSKRGNSC